MGWFGLITVILVGMLISTISIWTYINHIRWKYGIVISRDKIEVDVDSANISYNLTIKSSDEENVKVKLKGGK